jgi:7-keto-8-aminopelargonate synthetase-like enzyme
MDYDAVFTNHLQDLRREGRYRTFAELGRHAGRFPRAAHYESGQEGEITVWWSSDYFGMNGAWRHVYNDGVWIAISATCRRSLASDEECPI